MQRKPLAEQQEFVCPIAHVVVEKCSIIGDFMVFEHVHDLPLWSNSTGICVDAWQERDGERIGRYLFSKWPY